MQIYQKLLIVDFICFYLFFFVSRTEMKLANYLLNSFFFLITTVQSTSVLNTTNLSLIHPDDCPDFVDALPNITVPVNPTRDIRPDNDCSTAFALSRRKSLIHMHIRNNSLVEEHINDCQFMEDDVAGFINLAAYSDHLNIVSLFLTRLKGLDFQKLLPTFKTLIRQRKTELIESSLLELLNAIVPIMTKYTFIAHTYCSSIMISECNSAFLTWYSRKRILYPVDIYPSLAVRINSDIQSHPMNHYDLRVLLNLPETMIHPSSINVILLAYSKTSKFRATNYQQLMDSLAFIVRSDYVVDEWTITKILKRILIKGSVEDVERILTYNYFTNTNINECLEYIRNLGVARRLFVKDLHLKQQRLTRYFAELHLN